MADLRKNLLSKNPPPKGRPTRGASLDYTPTLWTEYFDSEDIIKVDQGRFHVYFKGKTGPILLCLHGGGYSGLTWALFAEEISKSIECQLVALDLRGHGDSSTPNDDDLSLHSLATDVKQVAEKLSALKNSTVILIGHSMGGAVAVEAANLIDAKGLCVIDVVEGTALDALSSMQNILRGRPKGFRSVEHAIQWCYQSGQTRNIDAARVSMPGQIRILHSEDTITTLESASQITGILEESEESSIAAADNDVSMDNIPLRTTEFTNITPLQISNKANYGWRIDLKKTEPYWTGWFQGLSQKFLNLPAPKILLLANINGLDTALTVGQMQGKFQFQVLAKSGHAIHEDQPHQVAEIIATYLVKQKLAEPKHM